MSRVINTNSPGKRRNAQLRTVAEILRRLSQKKQVDDETRDMTAALVYCLRIIDDTVEESISAWERRGYWKKADDFQQKWWWATLEAQALQELVADDLWSQLPERMMKLYPRVAHIQINRLTRDPSAWQGAYRQLKRQQRDL